MAENGAGSLEAERDEHGNIISISTQHLSAVQKRKFEQARRDMEEDVAKLAAERDRHAVAAQQLDMQMRVEPEAGQKDALQEEKRRHELMASEIERRMEEERARYEALMLKLSVNEEEKNRLAEKLQKLQAKMLAGGQKLKDLRAQQQEKLREERAKVAEVKRAQAQLAEEKKRVEEQRMMLEESYTSAKDELQSKTAKLKKMRQKISELEEELSTRDQEWSSERDGYLNAIRDSQRDSKLYKAILEQVLQRADLEIIIKQSTFDDDKEQWQLPVIELPMAMVKVRPRASASGSGSSGIGSGVSPSGGFSAASTSNPLPPRNSLVDRNQYRGRTSVVAQARSEAAAAITAAGANRPISRTRPEDVDFANLPTSSRPAFQPAESTPRDDPNQRRGSTAPGNPEPIDPSQVIAAAPRRPAFKPMTVDASSSNSPPIDLPDPKRNFSPSPPLSASPQATSPSSSLDLANLPRGRPAFKAAPEPHFSSVSSSNSAQKADPLASALNAPSKPAFSAVPR